jgi:hypothetical protein
VPAFSRLTVQYFLAFTEVLQRLQNSRLVVTTAAVTDVRLSWVGIEIVHLVDNRGNVYKFYDNFDTLVLKILNSFHVRFQSTEIQVV